LYAIHAGRASYDPIYDLESRIEENEEKAQQLESELEDIKSSISNLEYERD
jgi:predicted RNase H-like nuclease (RuvC/YqgF family)